MPAILAFISHFRLKQLDLRNDQVHADRLAAILGEKGEKIVPEEAAFVCLFKTAFFKGK